MCSVSCRGAVIGVLWVRGRAEKMLWRLWFISLFVFAEITFARVCVQVREAGLGRMCGKDGRVSDWVG